MKSALLTTLKMYQAWSTSRPQRCRYIPTCSHYASEAIEQHGAARGSWFAFKRVCRCNPLGSHGVDLVPEK